MRIDRFEAVVVRKVPYREADLILTLVSRQLGKVSVIARGARRSKKRFGASLDSFARSEFQISPTRRSELYTLQSATILREYGRIARDLAAIAHAGYMAEVTRELLAPEQPEPEVYDVLVEALTGLERVGAQVSRLRRFELSLLKLLGLLPDLNQCAGCRSAPELLFMETSRTGLLCQRCAEVRGVTLGRPIPTEVRMYLNNIFIADESQDRDEPEQSSAAATHGRDIMLDLISYHVGKALKSIEFLVKLSSGLQR